MSVGVSHTFGGTVVVVDMDTGRRWDLTPEMAETAAQQCVDAAGYMTASALIVISCLEDRQFRFAGNPEAMLKTAADLREHVTAGRQKAAAQPEAT